jgi:hypothetical protein
MSSIKMLIYNRMNKFISFVLSIVLIGIFISNFFLIVKHYEEEYIEYSKVYSCSLAWNMAFMFILPVGTIHFLNNAFYKDYKKNNDDLVNEFKTAVILYGVPAIILYALNMYRTEYVYLLPLAFAHFTLFVFVIWLCRRILQWFYRPSPVRDSGLNNTIVIEGEVVQINV